MFRLNQGKRSAMTSTRPRLRALREERGWTQQEGADQLSRLAWLRHRERVGVNADMVAKWERGEKRPSPPYRDLLCLLYAADAQSLGIGGGARPEAGSLHRPLRPGRAVTPAPAPPPTGQATHYTTPRQAPAGQQAGSSADPATRPQTNAAAAARATSSIAAECLVPGAQGARRSAAPGSGSYAPDPEASAADRDVGDREVERHPRAGCPRRQGRRHRRRVVRVPAGWPPEVAGRRHPGAPGH